MLKILIVRFFKGDIMIYITLAALHVCVCMCVYLAVLHYYNWRPDNSNV